MKGLHTSNSFCSKRRHSSAGTAGRLDGVRGRRPSSLAVSGAEEGPESRVASERGLLSLIRSGASGPDPGRTRPRTPWNLGFRGSSGSLDAPKEPVIGSEVASQALCVRIGAHAQSRIRCRGRSSEESAGIALCFITARACARGRFDGQARKECIASSPPLVGGSHAGRLPG